MERTRTHNLAVGSVCKLRAETLPTQPPRQPTSYLHAKSRRKGLKEGDPATPLTGELAPREALFVKLL